ncbi:MAG: hypothetical protein IJ046_01150, partial [Clostridia bacterium]|nr:hypothetical protein [Clostridia bacterium]
AKMNSLIFAPAAVWRLAPMAPQGMSPAFLPCIFADSFFKFFEGAETFSQKSFCKNLHPAKNVLSKKAFRFSSESLNITYSRSFPQRRGL